MGSFMTVYDLRKRDNLYCLVFSSILFILFHFISFHDMTTQPHTFSMVLFLLGRISIKVSVNGKETKHFAFWQLWCLGVVVCLFVFMSVGWMGWVMGMGWMDGTFLHFTLFQWGITAILHGTCKGRGKDGRVYSLAHSLTFVMAVWLAGMGWDGMGWKSLSGGLFYLLGL